jgi:hypothetical protein
METIHRAASAVSDTIFGEHGEHRIHPATSSKAGESTHEPLSGRTGDTTRGEPYDAGNLDETSQQRIAEARSNPASSTTTTTTTADTDSTEASRTAGTSQYPSATTNPFTTPSTDHTRRSPDLSPRSGPSVGPGPMPGTVPIPAANTARQGGSYSSARETAARAMSAAETPGSGHGAKTTTGVGAAGGAAGAGLWSAGAKEDEGGYEVDESGARAGEAGKYTRFAPVGEVDATDLEGSRAPEGEKKVKDVGVAGAGAGVGGAGAGAPGGAAGAGAEGLPGASAEGEPLGRRTSLTAHLPGAPGGEGLRRTSGAEGTGEHWVKSSGTKADGGDFDASAPGAGMEADREFSPFSSLFQMGGASKE